MVHCPECDAMLEDAADVEFEDLDADSMGFFRSAKRYYVISCANCEYMIGGGVAGAAAN